MDIQQIFGLLFLFIDFVLGILIVIIVILQGGKIRGIGNAITGTNDSALFDEEKKVFSELIAIKYTWMLLSAFIIINIVMVILNNYNLIAIIL